MAEANFLIDGLIFLAAAVLAVPISQRLGFGSVLGYLVAGSMLGPCGLKIIRNVGSIMHFAELGVVMLLFIIGLELKPSRLWELRRVVFGLGAAQVGVTTLLITLFGWSTGWSWLPSFVVGFGLSLSSTAFALQLLGERNQLTTQFGRMAFAILLFQDLAVIPLLAAMPLLSGRSQSSAAIASPGVVIGVIALIVVGGRYLGRPLFRMIASSRTREIFTAASLLLVLGVAAAMQAIGLSMALGTFLAGVILADSEYRHELEADINPFKGLLLGLFFMAVGMSVDYGLLLREPLKILAAVVGLVAIKGAGLGSLGKFVGLGWAASRNLAVSIAQGGEFAFVLFGMSAENGILPRDEANFLVLVVTLSMAVTPLLVLANDRIVNRLFDKGPPEFDKFDAGEPQVIIAGFGRVGQIPARVLRVKNIPYTALEHDSAQVEIARRYGQQIYYGDASRLDLLEAAGARTAKVFILAIDDIEASVRTAQVVKQHFPNLKIFARVRNRQHAYELMDLGLHVNYRETFVSSLELTHDVLRELGKTEVHAKETIRKFREQDEKSLISQHAVHRDEAALIRASKHSVQQLADIFQADKKSPT